MPRMQTLERHLCICAILQETAGEVHMGPGDLPYTGSAIAVFLARGVHTVTFCYILQDSSSIASVTRLPPTNHPEIMVLPSPRSQESTMGRAHNLAIGQLAKNSILHHFALRYCKLHAIPNTLDTRKDTCTI
jgi:hypothetical protein